MPLNLPSARNSIVALLWLGGIALGYAFALHFESTAGPSARVASSSPKDAGIELDGERYTLLVFAHPHCPCTRATIDELDRVVAACADRMNVRAFFYSDPALGQGWERSGSWNRAAEIPGVEVAADPLGRLASKFGVVTSGDVILYGPDGSLCFEGGITRARGHAGENPGARAIVDIVHERTPAVDRTPAFGCALVELSSDAAPETKR